jgi:outer membrane receptor for ferrienterochelin and colicins
MQTRKSGMKQKIILFQTCFFMFVLSCLCHAAAFGEEKPVDLTELSIEDLIQVTVYGASKFEQKITEAPSSVTIITSSEIEKYGYRTMSDILRSVRGLYITYDRTYNYAGIRGFNRPGDYNSRILLLVDGVRINDTVFDQVGVGTDFILDVDLIERVEIIRGPSSSLYGSNAFFGVINVITKKGNSIKGIELSGDAGKFESYRSRISYGNKFQNDIDLIFSGTYYESEGDDRLYYREFDAPETNNGVAEDGDSERFHSLFGKISFHEFTLEGALVNRKKIIPTAAFETVFNDNRTFNRDQSAFIDLKYESSFMNRWNVFARVFYSQYNYDGDYIYGTEEEGDTALTRIINKDYADAAWWGGEAQISTKLLEKHKLIFGADYRDNFRQDQGNYDEEVYLDSREDSTNWAIFAEDEFHIMSNLILNAGIRHDHYSTFGGTTNPRIGLLYNFLDKNSLKILYGKAFRAPNAFELFYQDGYSQKANPDLDPETIDTYELILEREFGENIRGTISGYYYKIEDLIDLVVDPADGLLVYRNVHEVEAKGVEMELEGHLKNGLHGRISYAYQESEDTKSGRDLTNSPRHLAKLNLMVPLVRKKIFLGVEEQYTGKRKTLDGNDANDYFITNVTLSSQNLIKGLKASASIYNLFDEKYSDPVSAEHLQDLIEQDGLSYRVKVTYSF